MSNWKISDTIVTKSDQLNAEDLLTANRVIKITGVKRLSDPQQPMVLNYEGDNGRPYKPCLTMRKLLAFAYGDDPNNLIGKSLELYTDPEVKFGKDKVGGVRICGMSDIKGTIKTSLTITRGKKKEFIVKPLKPQEKPPYPDDKFNAAFTTMEGWIKSGEWTTEQVINKCEQTGKLSDAQKKQIRDCEQDDDEPQFVEGEQ